MARIKMDIDFAVNKTAIEDIKRSLREVQHSIQDIEKEHGISDELKNAGLAARDLVNVLDKSWNTKLNQLDLSKLNNSINKTYGSLGNLKNILEKSGGTGAIAFDNLSRSILNTNLQLSKSSKLLDSMADTMSKTVKWGVASSVFNTITNSIQKAYNYTVKLDSSLNDIRIVTSKSADEMNRFAVNANKVAKNLGRSTKDFTEASLIYYQQGLGNEEAQARAEVTMKAANVTSQTGQEVSEQLTAVWNGYKVTAEEAELYVDKLAAVAAGTAADLEELSVGMGKVASAANIMGVDIDQLNAQLATIVSATRQAPESVGVALKTIYARMGDIKAGLDDETTLGKYTEKMAQYGVNVLDANNNLRDMGEVIEEIGNKWTTLSREQQVALSQVMAGTRQYNNLLSLFDNWDKYTAALEMSANAAGTLQEQQDIYMESTKAHLEQLRTEAERTYDILFDQDTVNGFADALTGLLGIFNNFLSGLGGGVNDFVYFGSIVTNIFKKQIADGINNSIDNLEKLKQNAAALDLMRQNTDTGYSTEAPGVRPGYVENDLARAEEILKIQSSITNEQFNELNALRQKVALQDEVVERMEAIKEANRDKTVGEIESDYKIVKKAYEEQIEAKRKILSITEEISNLEDGEEKKKKTKFLQDQIKLLQEEEISGIKINLSQKEKNNLKSIENYLTNNGNLTELKTEQLLKAQNKAITTLNNEQKERLVILKAIQMEEEEAYEALNKYSAEYNEKYFALARKQQITDLVQGISTFISLTSVAVGIFKTLNNETLSAGEKIENITTVLLTSLPYILLNLKSIKGIIPGVVAGTKSLAIALGVEGVTAASSFGTALTGIIAVIGPYALAIGAIVGAISLLIKAYNEEAIAAEEAKQVAIEASQAYEDLNKKAQNLKDTISDYSEGIEQLKELTNNTKEYEKTLDSVNQKAKDLIETYKLYDKYSYENGILKIDTDAINSIEEQARQNARDALVYKYITENSKNVAENLSKKTNLQRRIGYIYNDDINKGTTYNKDSSDYNTFFGKQLSKDSIDSIIKSINNIRIANQNEYDLLIKNNDKFRETINTLGETNPAIKSTTEQIIKNKEAFFELADSTYEVQRSFEYNAKQIVSGIISSKFSQEITSMAFENGAYNAGKAAQISSILQKMPGSKSATDYTTKISDIDISNLKILENESLNAIIKKLESETNAKNLEKYLIENDEDLIKTYAKEILGKEESELSKMQYKSGWWSRSLLDEKGNFVINDKDDSEMRKQIAQKAISDITTQNTESLLNEEKLITPLKNALNSAKEYGKMFGTDFSDSLLNALDDNSHKFDFSSLFARIDPNEYQEIFEQIDYAKQIEKISQATEGTDMFLSLLGLSEQDIKDLGFESVKTFIAAFEEGWQGWEWDVDKAVGAAVAAKNDEFDLLGLSKKKLEEYQDTVQDYAKNLMVVAENSNELAKSLEIDADAAVDVAYAVIKMNKAIETLADNIEDWEDIIKNSTKESQEYAEAMIGIRDILADVYNTESKYVSNDFVAEHLEEIKRIAEGDEEAIESLRNSLTDDIIMNIMINNELDTSVKDDVMNSIHQLQTEIPDIKIGTSLDLEKVEGTEAAFMESMQHIIDAAGLTAEQANALFNTMGFQAAFKTEEVPTDQEVPEYVTETLDDGTHTETLEDGTKQTWIRTRTRTYQDGVYKAKGKMTAIAMETSTDGTKVPTITNLTKTSSGSMNNYSSRNAGGKNPGKSSKTGGGGGGGGSSKEPQKMDPLEKEVDRYHDVDIQLKNIQTDLDKLDKQKKKLFGKDLIGNLNKKLDLLNKQIDTTNEKIRIAQGETQELKDKLANQGVAFNIDGTIANYASAYAAQLNYVNSLIEQYNNMSAEEQESFKDTVEQAKKDFDKFTNDLDRYDTVITELIPGLESDIQSAIDEKIDLQIEKFDMEIEIRLNLAEAERDWNDFKKKIIDGIEDDDILGNAMAKLVDFSSYYKEDDTGIVQALRKQVDNTLAELNQMDTNGWSSVYGDNRTAALEDLQKYYKELMTNLEDVLALQKEIHESYINMMDEAQEKFDEQIKSYEMITDLIDHDMKVISLVYGEESYSQLARYYDKQQQNFNSQLDFQRQQVDFWRQQLDSLEEGSDAWENAKEKWANAVEELNSLIEDSIQNLQDKYLNAINLIFQNLNNKVTDGLGLDYIEEEWTLINKNADQYLDTINSLYETQKLENKYLDAIDKTDSVSAQRQLKKLMDEELADLRERDKLTQYDIERANKKYEIALKQIALQEAQQNKSKMRLRRDSQGNYRYEYTADNDQVGQLQDELNDMYNSLYNFDKAKYQDNLDQLYSVWAEFQEKMAEAAQINDPALRAEKELLLQEHYGELINGLTEQNATIRNNLNESAFDDLARLYDTDVSNFQNMSDQEKDILMGDLVPYWESGVQHMADVFAGEGGFLGVCQDAFEQLHEATKDYENGLVELENTGRISFEDIGESIDRNIDRTRELIRDNAELIDSYGQELMAIQNVILELDQLVNKYNLARDAAIAATKAAYEYWSEQQREAAADASAENSGSANNNIETSNNSNVNTSNSNESSSSGGDGNLTLGETATFNGQYYYDSYGTSPIGSKYSGVADGIVVDRITNNPYGIHIHSADGKYPDLGWIKKSQLSGYDTGGYTGTWGSEGRLALLHQKELVLNKEDTENMLSAINIMRNITSMLGSSILGKLAAATAGNMNSNIGNDILEQNVHIDAQFPNVKDSREIEEALNNLVNMASMRANRR